MSPLTLDSVRYGDNVPYQKITQRLKSRTRAIPSPRGLHPQTTKPVLLELAGQRNPPPAAEDLMPQRPEDRPDRIPEPRPERARPQRMDGSAVPASVLDRPQRLDVSLKITRHVAMNPDPPPLTSWTSRRSRKRISLAFPRQPLYIRPKIEYQYSAVLGRTTGDNMSPTCPGQPFPFVSK